MYFYVPVRSVDDDHQCTLAMQSFLSIVKHDIKRGNR